MIILVINCGSSSLKYQLMDMDTKNPIAKGVVERIGMEGSVLTHSKPSGEKEKITAEIPDHTAAIGLVLKALVHPKYGAVKNLNEIFAVGHRVLHGGYKFSASVKVDDAVMDAIKECIPLGPLHNPANIAGIEACQKLMPGTPQVAVFDTAFHQTIPDYAYIYGLPYELYEKHNIRRYGFHGTSHKYVSQRAAVLLQKPADELKLISCHLGNGSSLAAIMRGKCIETTMGFTPLAGLLMGTRSGNLDPAIVPYIMEKENLGLDQINDYLNKKCGILGVSGVSSDFRDVEAEAKLGNYRAQLAMNIFVHDVKKYIGAYAAALDGADAIIFTAGVGENSPEIRAEVCSKLSYLGVSLDQDKNKVRGEEIDISTADARCRVLVIPTNEELMIAIDTLELTR